MGGARRGRRWRAGDAQRIHCRRDRPRGHHRGARARALDGRRRGKLPAEGRTLNWMRTARGTVPTAPMRSGVKLDLRRAVSAHISKIALAAVIALIVLVTATQSSVFFTIDNFKNIFSQIAVVGILACGMTLLMVSGGIDLSVGSSVSFCG